MKKTWTVYLIETENGLIYTGITTDMERRFAEHSSKIKAAKFFARSPPKKILRSWNGFTQSRALKLEYAIKQLSKADKATLTSLSTLLKKITRPKRKVKPRK